jgi:hypothetical protein
LIVNVASDRHRLGKYLLEKSDLVADIELVETALYRPERQRIRQDSLLKPRPDERSERIQSDFDPDG